MRVANAEMVRALRVMTVERGLDPRDFALLAFGGAGPLHAAAIAGELGMTRILVPRASGVLSALGLAAAERRRDRARTVLLRGDGLTREALSVEDGEAAYDVRYAGQSHELTVRGCGPEPAAVREAFEAAHEERYGFRDPVGDIEVVTIRVRRAEPGPSVEIAAGGGPGAVTGPAVVALPEATVLVPEGWRGAPDATGHARPGARALSGLDPIELQVVSGALRAACEEMGAVLVRSAHSANIKERRDCSTALFDPAGEMVMQAEHIPVHLGAMPAAVAAVLDRDHGEPGAVVSWVLNDPFAGGTHLPDITVVTPVLERRRAARLRRQPRPPRRRGRPRARARCRPTRTTLEEEGVVIAPRPLDDAAIDELAGRMRQPGQRRADLRAQLAANRTGAHRLTELAARVGAGSLRAATDAVLDYAERRTRACLAALEDGTRRATDVLEAREGDLELRLAATVRGDELDARLLRERRPARGQPQLPAGRDALGLSLRPARPHRPRHPAQRRRAPAPVACACPTAALLNARPGAAVAGGNVETSSRVADLVLAAFGRALGQGTMNNVTLGNERFTYYETLGGGQGACPDADGPSGVHVAMSNTLNTPVEALELEFPLRVVALRGAPRLGRSGTVPRRRRRRARGGGAGGDGVLGPHRAPAARAARRPGRFPRRARAQRPRR